MPGVLICAIVGALICFFGVRNIMGDISSLHSYHRSRVSENDVKPFGKMVGIGTLIIGISVILMSLFTLVAELSKNEAFVYLGTVIMFIGIVAGCVISFYAMKKYNGGIF